MANRRKMTAAERERFEAIKARIAAKKAAEDTEDEEKPEEVEVPKPEEKNETEEAKKYSAKERAYAAYLARKQAQEVKKDEEDIPPVVDVDEGTPEQPAMDIEPEPKPEEDEKDAIRAKAIARAKKAQEVSDDLTGPDGDSSNIEEISNDGEHVSDDLANTDEGDGDTAQTPPDSVDEAESKVLAAYDLIEKQVAQKVIASNVHRASLAHEYCKTHTLGEMKFAAEQLEKVGSAKKTAGNVRVTRRGSGLQNKKTASETGMDSSILFY